MPYGLPAGDRLSYFWPGPESVPQKAESTGWNSQLPILDIWLGALKRESEPHPFGTNSAAK